MRRLLLAAALGLLSIACQAQPAAPVVRLLVPFAPGGSERRLHPDGDAEDHRADRQDLRRREPHRRRRPHRLGGLRPNFRPTARPSRSSMRPIRCCRGYSTGSAGTWSSDLVPAAHDRAHAVHRRREDAKRGIKTLPALIEEARARAGQAQLRLGRRRQRDPRRRGAPAAQRAASTSRIFRTKA